MKFLIDTRSAQAAVHYGVFGDSAPAGVREVYNISHGRRLSQFIGLIEEISGVLPDPSPGLENELRLPYLSKYDCLVLTTRIYQFSQEELHDIRKFVENGSSLLVMSNHPPFDERDDKLGRTFGFSFKSPMYPWHGGRYGLTTIRQNNLGNHPITESLSEGIIFNNSCRIALDGIEKAIVLASLPEESPPDNIFALAMDGLSESQSGRIVAVADSGFIGGADTDVPGPGQFEKGDNPKFLRNIISWLCHKL